MILAGYLHKLFARQSKLAPVGAKVLVDQFIAERIVSCRDRSMRRKERVSGNHLACLVKVEASSNQFPAALQVQEGRVSFVDMPGRGGNPQGAQGANAANTQHYLLRDAHLTVATVQPR